MPFLWATWTPHASPRPIFSLLCSTSTKQGQLVSGPRIRPRPHSTRTEQAVQAEAAPISSIGPDQTPGPGKPKAELSRASPPSVGPDQTPASSVPDTKPNAVSVVATENSQAAAPRKITFPEWRWRIWRYIPQQGVLREGVIRPTIETSDFSTLREEVRRAMRAVPHALAVVTSQTPRGVTKGLVVSSFNTVTLHPRPYVSFNIKLPSETYDAIARSHKFTITSIWSAETAKAFANPHFSKRRPIPLEEADPRSLHAGGLFSLDCKWKRSKSVEVQDHVIMLGRVDGYHPGRPQNITKSPLVYVNGDYQMGRRSNP